MDLMLEFSLKPRPSVYKRTLGARRQTDDLTNGNERWDERRRRTDLDDLALLSVMLNDRFSLLLEGLQTLHNGGLVVIGTTARLTAFEKTLFHHLLTHLKV
eukprot:TsM_000854800 transcript=TsM_000854800 gene=TsM_000854800